MFSFILFMDSLANLGPLDGLLVLSSNNQLDDSYN